MLRSSLGPATAPDEVLVPGPGRAHSSWAQTLGVPHKVVNLSLGKRARDGYRIQTANARHCQLQSFPRPFQGVASKCLEGYLRWFQRDELTGRPSPPGSAWPSA